MSVQGTDFCQVEEADLRLRSYLVSDMGRWLVLGVGGSHNARLGGDTAFPVFHAISVEEFLCPLKGLCGRRIYWKG